MSNKIINRLTFYEREQIEYYLKHGRKVREIGRFLRRDHSVISREINRHTGNYLPYSAKASQDIAGRDARKTNKRKLDKDERLCAYVLARLKDDWSPDEIAGRLKHDPPVSLKGRTISDESIYQYIYESPYGRYWYRYLRRKNAPRRQKFHSRTHRISKIPDRVSIHLRPLIVAEKQRYGDWESDSMIFRKQKTALSVQYERKAMLVRMHKIRDKSAHETDQALIKSVESLPLELWKTMTFDNGGEGAHHGMLGTEFGIDTFFCDPYKSWQKGGVENANGLIRQYLPRGTNLASLTDRDIYEIQERLNNRPRKGLRYKTPNEIIQNLTGGLIGALNS